MNETPHFSNHLVGRVASLHLHPEEPGEPFTTVASIEVVAGKGIIGNPRYFARKSRSGGPSKRQLSLIEREQISEHAAALGLESIAAGTVRSNIETTGIDLIKLVGKHVQIGNAIIHFYEPRTPCEKMDAICVGLRGLMSDGKQGVMAQVVRSGQIAIGDAIVPCESPAPAGE